VTTYWERKVTRESRGSAWVRLQITGVQPKEAEPAKVIGSALINNWGELSRGRRMLRRGDEGGL